MNLFYQLPDVSQATDHDADPRILTECKERQIFGEPLNVSS